MEGQLSRIRGCRMGECGNRLGGWIGTRCEGAWNASRKPRQGTGELWRVSEQERDMQVQDFREDPGRRI